MWYVCNSHVCVSVFFCAFFFLSATQFLVHCMACYHSRLLWHPLGVFEYEYAPLWCGQHIGSCEINAVNSIRPGYQGICHSPVHQTLFSPILTHLNNEILRLEIRCL